MSSAKDSAGKAFDRLAKVVQKFTELRNRDMIGRDTYISVAIGIPTNVEWNESITNHFCNNYGDGETSVITYYRGMELVKPKDQKIYRRSVLKHSFVWELRCTISILEKIYDVTSAEEATADAVAIDSVRWDMKDISLIMHSPGPSSSAGVRSDSTLHGWDLEGGKQWSLTDSSPKLFVKFPQNLGQPLPLRDIRSSLVRVWGEIYSSSHVYTMSEAEDVLRCLPTQLRISVHLKRKHISSSTDFLCGYVATPTVPPSADVYYIVHMHTGLWMFHIKSKSLRVITRDIHMPALQNTSMLQLPIHTYLVGDCAYLDPLLPFSFSEWAKLAEHFNGKRAVYDVDKLGILANICSHEIPDTKFRVGTIWQYGGPSTTTNRFANSEVVIHPHHEDSLDYRKYVLGKTNLDTFGVTLVDPGNQGVQLMASYVSDSVTMLLCTAGVLCKVPLDKQRKCDAYARGVSSECVDAVAYRGTRINPFEYLTRRCALNMDEGEAYIARLRMDSNMDTLHLENLQHVGKVEHLSSQRFALTLSMAKRVWYKLTHPVWPYVAGRDSLHRSNLCTWYSVSRCLNLQEENVKMLIVSQNLNMFYTTLDSLPQSWEVSHLDLNSQQTTGDRQILGLSRYGILDTNLMHNIQFTHVVLHLCNNELHNTVSPGLRTLMEHVIPGAKHVVQFVFDRGMIREYPFNFRYSFGNTKLMTYHTSNRDLNMWVLKSPHSEYLDCPLDFYECAGFLHNMDFTPDPQQHPFHLSTFVTITPECTPEELPEKLIVCTSYCPQSDSSPTMIPLAGTRDIDITSNTTIDSSAIAKVLQSANLFLIQTPTCKESIIHSFLMVSSDVYRSLGDRFQDKNRLVKCYRRRLLHKMKNYNVSIPQVCKGIHIEPLAQMELFIYNIVAGGNVTSTMIPRSRELANEQRFPKCVAILRVSEDMAYPVVRMFDGVMEMTHSTSSASHIGRDLSVMTRAMVHIDPSH